MGPNLDRQQMKSLILGFEDFEIALSLLREIEGISRICVLVFAGDSSLSRNGFD